MEIENNMENMDTDVKAEALAVYLKENLGQHFSLSRIKSHFWKDSLVTIKKTSRNTLLDSTHQQSKRELNAVMSWSQPS